MKNTNDSGDKPKDGAAQRERPLRWRGGRSTARAAPPRVEAAGDWREAERDLDGDEAIARLLASRRRERGSGS